MIFKSVSLSAIEDINKITKQFLPYSVFSITDLLRWSDTNVPTQYCIFNNNLIIKIRDYIKPGVHNDFLYGFMGNIDVDRNIEYLIKEFNKLDLIPEETVTLIKSKSKYTIVNSENNSNYILSINNTLNLSGHGNKEKRKLVNKCTKIFTKKTLDLNNDTDVNNILELFHHWQFQKKAHTYEIERELNALKTTIKYSKYFKYYNMGIYDRGRLIGFTINEVMRRDWVDGCFGKTDLDYSDLSKYLEYETAKILKKNGFKYINIEQDLGLEGLRKYKQSLNPIMTLHMYSIKLRK